MAEAGIQHSFELSFMCEIKEDLHGWEDDVMKTIQPKKRPCIFPDITQLWRGECPCKVHKRLCPVDFSAEGAITGLSCKDFNKQNPSRWARGRGSVLDSETSPGKSADTWWGLVKFIDRGKLKWLILESD